ncbi:MAG: hypothetical protein WBQ66_18410, partial [Blastocatellia bacterium]
MRFGRTIRIGFAALVLVATIHAGPIGITNYTGPAFPYSAGFHTATSPPDMPASDRAGTFIARGTNRFVDVMASSEPGPLGFESIVSAVDPTVFYVDRSVPGGGSIDVVRVVGGKLQSLRSIPLRRPLGSVFGGFIGVKRHPSGSDVVYFYASVTGLAAILDHDGDGLADTILDRDDDGYDDHLKFGDFGITAVSANGTGYGIVSENNPFPNPDHVYAMTVWDTDGDLVPDTPAWQSDPRGRRELPGALPGAFYAGAVDEGTGRLVLGYRGFYGALEIDGDGFPVAQTPRSIPQGVDGGSGPELSIRSYFRPSTLPDGSVAALLYVSVDQMGHELDGVYVFDDQDFSGQVELYTRDLGEVFPALTSPRFDPVEGIGLPSAHELTELHLGDTGVEHIEFADFGIWPDGSAFSFRQAGVERASVDVSSNGILSFVGPIEASPSLESLDATPGLVAAAWSDQWDTSEVRVFAGCAPTQRRFADGSGSAALSFVIEWRGLISPNGKRTSLRCLLLEDGSFRVDYGAMEIGEMPLVVGYSTDGADAIIPDDLSDNSWGGQPAGTLEEAALGEEFGAAKPFDLEHKWIRFAGYGDVRGPRPELIAVALKKGNKIQMKAVGSNIQSGAMLIVDGTETFELSKSATGSKWVVTKKAL